MVPERKIGGERAAALAALEAGRPQEAESLLRSHLRHDPTDAAGWFFLGNALVWQEDLAAAQHAFRRAAAEDPACVEALGNLSVLLLRQGDLADAADAARRAVERRSDYPEGWANLGVALTELGRLEEGMEAHRHALSLVPDQPHLLCNMASALEVAGEFDEAATHFDRALSLVSDLAPARFGRAVLALRDGDFERGWRDYEWRWAKVGREPGLSAAPPWRGEALPGKTLLLFAEQGLGDSLQMLRYVPLAAERGARVILALPAPLIRLAAGGMEGGGRVVDMAGELPPHDLQVPLMSLPWIFGTRLDTVPADIPYVRPDPLDVAAWAGRLESLAGTRVGLVWAGESRRDDPRSQAVDRRRSMPLDALHPVLELDGIGFASLQLGPAAAQIDRLAPDLRPMAVMEGVRDFADTAAILAHLDLIITVDTSMAHLAGALGRPVWVLNRHDSCWRWLRDRDDSPWYPTMRLFRQPKPGDWAGVVDPLCGALKNFRETALSAGWDPV